MIKAVIVMFRKISQALQRFMYGRNGVDELSWALVIVGLILSIIGAFVGIAIVATILTLVSYICLILAIWRMFSKNVDQRHAENQKLISLWKRIKDRQHRYFSCPSCKQTVRVPKGKGKVNIRCPKCGEQFIKKT